MKYETIQKAAARGYLVDVEFHLQKGVDVNARNVEGYTPLMLAVGKGHPAVAEFLKQHGATE